MSYKKDLGYIVEDKNIHVCGYETYKVNGFDKDYVVIQYDFSTPMRRRISKTKNGAPYFRYNSKRFMLPKA